MNGDHGTKDARHDELLAIRCQLGERAAFDELVERWHGPLWSYVRRMIADEDDAAETTQDVWLRVLRALPRLRDPSRFRAWLFGIARRAVMDHLRRRYAEPPHEAIAPDMLAVADDRDDSDIARRFASLHEELDFMPVTERDVLVLFYLRELTLADVAEVLEVPVGTVKSRLFRARQMLRRRLEQGEAPS